MSGRTPQPVIASDLPAMVEPKVGSRIGTYRLIRLIGEGAAGRVFEVEHLKIGRRAAMKILAPAHAARPGAIQRLFAEARAVNKISHPHILEVTDMLQADADGGVNAIVMELLEGASLGHAMHPPGSMPPGRYLPILAQVASALGAAHEARFVHRDLKPDNIFLITLAGQRDFVKLLDFGLAKSIAGDVNVQALPSGPAPPHAALPPPMQVDLPVKASRTIIHATADGTFVGTPAYASPEQAAGKPLDHRTDIYSLGVILYELLCGQLPFDGKNFGEFLVKHITAPVPPAPPEVTATDFGRQLFGLAERCLAKKPADRPASAAELKAVFEDLSRQASSVSLTAMPSLSVLKSQGIVRSRRRLLGGLSVGVVAVAGAATYWLGAVDKDSRTTARGQRANPSESQARSPVVTPLLPDTTKQIVLTFKSDPPGAETRRIGSDELLGLTPFLLTFVANGKEVEFEMRLPGYQPRRETITLSQSVAVGGRLRKNSPGAEARRADNGSGQPEGAGENPVPEGAAREVTRGTTLNPFSR